MKWTMLRTMAAACAALLLATGCDQTSQDNLKEQANDAKNKASQVASDAAAKAREGWDNLKTELTPQIDQMNEKLATLKTEAAKFKDTQLDGYISEIDAKIRDTKAKLAETFSAEGFEGLKQNVGQWMTEAKDLYNKAVARLAELTKSAGGTTPGGG